MKERLEAIKKRLEKVTPGPWRSNKYGEVEGRNHHGLIRSLARMFKQPCCGRDVQFPTAENAEFIAHAREDVPWLIEQLEVREPSLLLDPTPIPPVSEKLS